MAGWNSALRGVRGASAFRVFCFVRRKSHSPTQSPDRSLGGGQRWGGRVPQGAGPSQTVSPGRRPASPGRWAERRVPAGRGLASAAPGHAWNRGGGFPSPPAPRQALSSQMNPLVGRVDLSAELRLSTNNCRRRPGGLPWSVCGGVVSFGVFPVCVERRRSPSPRHEVLRQSRGAHRPSGRRVLPPSTTRL